MRETNFLTMVATSLKSMGPSFDRPIAWAIKATATILVGLSVGATTSAHASDEPCQLGTGDDSALLKCYQSDYQTKFKANESRYKVLIARAKDLFQEAAEAEVPRRVLAYSELIRKVNHSVLDSRKSASQQCVRVASKFQSPGTSAVASLNCRTDHEVQLEKQLRQFESQLESQRPGPNNPFSS